MIAIPPKQTQTACGDSSLDEGPRPLAAATTGRQLWVAGLPAAGGDTERLQAMGLCVGRRVELVQAGSPAIVRLVGARVGISAQLAESILVQTAPPRGEATPAKTQSLSDVA